MPSIRLPFIGSVDEQCANFGGQRTPWGGVFFAGERGGREVGCCCVACGAGFTVSFLEFSAFFVFNFLRVL